MGKSRYEQHLPRSPSLGSARSDPRIRDARRRREGEGAQGRRPPGDRLRRRRARLPHARLHRRGCGGRRTRSEEPQVHSRQRASPNSARPSRARPGRQRGDGLPRRHPRDERRQAGRLRSLRGDRGRRRRSPPPHPLLDDLPRGDPPGRGRSGQGVRRSGARLQGRRRPAGGGPDPGDEGPAAMLAVEPDGIRVLPRGDPLHRPVGGGERPVGGHRRDLRAPRLRRNADGLPSGRGAGAGEPGDRAQRRGQDLRHDRLAPWAGCTARPTP